jgi:hypothetical protein
MKRKEKAENSHNKFNFEIFYWHTYNLSNLYLVSNSVSKLVDLGLSAYFAEGTKNNQSSRTMTKNNNSGNMRMKALKSFWRR